MPSALSLMLLKTKFLKVMVWGDMAQQFPSLADQYMSFVFTKHPLARNQYAALGLGNIELPKTPFVLGKEKEIVLIVKLLASVKFKSFDGVLFFFSISVSFHYCVGMLHVSYRVLFSYKLEDLSFYSSTLRLWSPCITEIMLLL